jgi:S-adenosylmethionine uptake transporter
MIGYFFSIEAMRYGDVSFVSPFRYTLIVWALLIGIFFFNETLDYLSFIGILLIMFSGIFVLYRESKIKNFS